MKCNRLLLFDIDCTLLNTGGAGMAAFHSAAEELYSEQIAQKNGLQLDMAGSTDFGLIMEIFKSWESKIQSVKEINSSNCIYQN